MEGHEELFATLGTRRKDRATGFEGRVVAICATTEGYRSVRLADIDSTGRPIEDWYDITRTDAVGGEV